MSEGWSRKHVVSGDHSHVQRRERVRPRRTENCGGGGEENWEITFLLGGERPQQQEGEKGGISQNMPVGRRRMRGVRHTGGNQGT